MAAYSPRRFDVRPRRRRGIHSWPALLALTLAGLLVSGGAGALAYLVPALTAVLSSTGQAAKALTPSSGGGSGSNSGGAVAPGSSFTVLFLGSDDDVKFDPKSLLTQSMILVRVDPASKHATMLSIPRDLYVPVSGGSSNKIMAAYSYGGADAAIATVSRDFQVRIDDYVWVGLKGLVKLIDLVGGVDVTTANPILDDFYPNDLESSNAFGYKRVAVLAGPQHLDGLRAMEYVRSRHSDLEGDLGRGKRRPPRPA